MGAACGPHGTPGTVPVALGGEFAHLPVGQVPATGRTPKGAAPLHTTGKPAGPREARPPPAPGSTLLGAWVRLQASARRVLPKSRTGSTEGPCQVLAWHQQLGSTGLPSGSQILSRGYRLVLALWHRHALGRASPWVPPRARPHPTLAQRSVAPDCSPIPFPCGAQHPHELSAASPRGDHRVGAAE